MKINPAAKGTAGAKGVKEEEQHPRPKLALVLGSGFLGVADAGENPRAIPYSKLAGFP